MMRLGAVDTSPIIINFQLMISSFHFLLNASKKRHKYNSDKIFIFCSLWSKWVIGCLRYPINIRSNTRINYRSRFGTPIQMDVAHYGHLRPPSTLFHVQRASMITETGRLLGIVPSNRAHLWHLHHLRLEVFLAVIVADHFLLHKHQTIR